MAARALPNKSQETVVAAMKDILESLPEHNRPSVVQADNGSEFQTKMEAMLQTYGIKLIHSQAYNPSSQAMVERANRTLKSAIFEYFTRSGTKRWIDVLQSFIDNFNNSIHGSTKEVPAELMEEKELPREKIAKIRQRLINRVQVPTNNKIFNVGDFVRVALTSEASVRKQTFRKKIAQNWSDTVYQIYSVSQPETQGTQEQYLLKNLTTNRKSKKKYWSYQLQHTKPAEEPAEEQLKKENIARRSQMLERLADEREPREPVVKRIQRSWAPSRDLLERIANT